MKKNLYYIIILFLVFLLLLSGCTKKDESINDTAQTATNTQKLEDKKDEKSKYNKKSEEEMQLKEGVNSKFPDIQCDYASIVNSSGGIYQFPSVYEEDYQKNVEIWKENVRNEVQKIEPKLNDDASEDEIEDIFKNSCISLLMTIQ